MNRCGRFGNTHSSKPFVACSGMSMAVVRSGGKGAGGVNMFDKVLCPWCGAEMEINTIELNRRHSARMECHNSECNARGPMTKWHDTEEKAIENARAAALRRYTPQIKPMTLEEVKDLRVGTLVWSEHIPKWRADDGMCVYNGNPGDGYGRLYRYWAGRKPTDEERSAAEWEK